MVLSAILRRTLLIASLFGFVMGPPFLLAQPVREIPDTSKQFISFLQNLELLSLGEKTTALEAYAGENPACEEAYQLLVEWYKYSDVAEKKIGIWKDKKRLWPRREYANWMLHHLYLASGDTSLAWIHIREASRENPESVRIVRDFMRFLEYQEVKFRETAFSNFLSSISSPGTRDFCKAYFNYHFSDSQLSGPGLADTEPRFREHPIILAGVGYLQCLQDSIEAGMTSLKKAAQASIDQPLIHSLVLALIGNQYYLEWCHNNEARIWLDSSMTVAQKSGSFYNLQLSGGYLSDLLKNIGYSQKAAELAYSARRIAIKLGEPRLQANWEQIYASAKYNQGDYGSALHWMRQSSKTRGGVSYKILIDRIQVYLALQEFDLAEHTFNKLKNIKADGLSEYLPIQASRLEAYQGNYHAARGSLSTYLKNRRHFPINRVFHELADLARCYFLEGQYVEAQRYYKKALQGAKIAANPLFQSWYLLRLGDIARQFDEVRSAKNYYRRADSIATDLDAGELLWEIHYGFGQVARKIDSIDVAIRHFRKAATILETNRLRFPNDDLRVDYFIQGSSVYRGLTECFLSKYDRDKAIKWLDSLIYVYEAGRGRALKDLMSEKSFSDNDTLAKALEKGIRRQQSKIRKMIVDVASSKDKLQFEELVLDSLRAELRAIWLSDPRTVETLPTFEARQKAGVQDFQLHLAELDAGLLFYHLSPDRSFALLVKRNDVQVIDLGVSLKALDQNLADLLHPMHNVSEKNINKVVYNAGAAFKLFRQLFEPMQHLLTDTPKILIVPDPRIADLPFEMLLGQAAPKEKYLPNQPPEYFGDCLITKYNFCYLPSASLLLNVKDLIPRQPSIAVFADPYYYDPKARLSSAVALLKGNWRFSPLNHSRDEGMAIEKIFESSKLFLGREFTRSHLQQVIGKADYLHLSAHGFADSKSEAFSGLAFSADSSSRDDGLLLGYDIQRLDLSQVAMVTLSACETGKGRTLPGEGALGLPRFIISSGARSVLMTRWKVSDSFSARLMPAFYRSIRENTPSRPQALRRAIRQVTTGIGDSQMHERLDFRHPFFWAAFAVYGLPGI